MPYEAQWYSKVASAHCFIDDLDREGIHADSQVHTLVKWTLFHAYRQERACTTVPEKVKVTSAHAHHYTALLKHSLHN